METLLLQETTETLSKPPNPTDDSDRPSNLRSRSPTPTSVNRRRPRSLSPPTMAEVVEPRDSSPARPPGSPRHSFPSNQSDRNNQPTVALQKRPRKSEAWIWEAIKLHKCHFGQFFWSCFWQISGRFLRLVVEPLRIHFTQVYFSI